MDEIIQNPAKLNGKIKNQYNVIINIKNIIL